MTVGQRATCILNMQTIVDLILVVTSTVHSFMMVS